MSERIAIGATHPAVHQADGYVSGPWVFTSALMADDGQNGLAPEAHNPAGYPYFEAPIKLQVRHILRKAAKILAAKGAGLEHVVKAQAYLTHPSDFVPLDEAWGEFFPKNVSRTFVATSQLPVPGARISIELIACLPEAGRDVVRGNAASTPAFSRKVEATRVGNVIFTSGQLGYDSRAGFVPEAKQDREAPEAGSNLVRQARLTVANLSRSLEAVGGSGSNVARAQIFLTEMDQLASFERDWKQMLPAAPAATIVGAGLFVPEGLIEVDFTGYAASAGDNAGPVGDPTRPSAFRVDDLVFASAQLPADADGLVPLSTLPHPTFPNYASAIKLQTRHVLSKLVDAFEAAGIEPNMVAKTTVFLTDLADYWGMNEVWREVFPAPHARTVILTPSVGPRHAKLAVDAIAVS